MKERDELLQGLDERRAKHQALVAQCDPLHVVHPKSGWCVKDIVAHVTLWEAEIVRLIEHALRGEHYVFPDIDRIGIDGFNQRAHERTLNDSAEQVYTHWHTVRETLKAVLLSATPEQWSVKSVRFFGAETTIGDTAKGIARHEKTHMQEIEASLNS